jgi:hypothetical protein
MEECMGGEIDRVWAVVKIDQDGSERIVGFGNVANLVTADAPNARRLRASIARVSDEERATIRFVEFSGRDVLEEFVRPETTVWDRLAREVPEKFRVMIQRYVELHTLPEATGTDHVSTAAAKIMAILRNDLSGAYGLDNTPLYVGSIVHFLREHAPPECWGSPERVEAWINFGPCARCTAKRPRLGPPGAEICGTCADDLRAEAEAIAGTMVSIVQASDDDLRSTPRLIPGSIETS